MTLNPETVRELAVAGVGAIVLPSLFEEQIVHDLMAHGVETRNSEAKVASGPGGSHRRAYSDGPGAYLDAIRSLKRGHGLPIIASLNGCTSGAWLKIGREMQAAGADALEVTLEPELQNAESSGDAVEQGMLDCVGELCALVSIPVSVKLSPFHTSLAHLAWRLAEAGASGVVCFAHEPTWEVRTDRIETSFNWSLTPASNINQTVAGLLRVSAGGVSMSVAASGGIATVDDIAKSVLAGADTVMLTSEIYRRGPDVVAQLFQELCQYLEQHRMTHFDQLIGARPKVKACLRSDQLKCVSAAAPFDNTSPYVSPRGGDRWGHIV
jgi:dihydroorotate dehydrogenase (fumarate)